ncbi:hypothetical protein MPSI1_000245 [Malassezia psittaci]|uniref:Uncharacterized protein n=1 Tax=Malassezia psittaci TaxID=1821823 RepID=A0AAF0F7T0_9BASI|nr:hypothetical protein MPSI1_000245 [Malassezia psittaci]
MQGLNLPEELRTKIFKYACTITAEDSAERTEDVKVANTCVSDHLQSRCAQPSSSSTAILFPALPHSPRSPKKKGIDPATTIKIMQVNLHCYALGAQLLYRTPRLTKPSQLIRLAESISLRPILGRLIENLYVGSIVPRKSVSMNLFQGEFTTAERGLHLTPEYPNPSLETSRHVHPCDPLGSILPHIVEREISELTALFAGPDGAQGFDLHRPGFDHDDNWIGIGSWVIKLHETRCLLRWMRALAYQERLETVQSDFLGDSSDAVFRKLRKTAGYAQRSLDNFLQVYDQEEGRSLFKRRTGTRSDPYDWADASVTPDPLPEGLPVEEYEALLALQWCVIESWPSSWCDAMPHWLCAQIALSVAYGRYLGLKATISEREEILQEPYRMDVCLSDARRQALAFFVSGDCFDDLCLYARSGAMHFLVGDEFAVYGPAAIPSHAELWSEPQRSTNGDLLVPTVDDMIEGSFSHRPLNLLPSVLTIPSTRDTKPKLPNDTRNFSPTLGSLIASVRSILCSTTNLQTLGLSGVLERAVAGELSSLPLKHLKYVFLGPPPPYWAHPLQFGAGEHSTFANVRHISISGCLLFQDEAAALAGANDALPNLESITWSMYHNTWEDGAQSIIRSLMILLEEPEASAQASENVGKQLREPAKHTLKSAELTKWLSSGPAAPPEAGAGAAAVPAKAPELTSETVPVIEADELVESKEPDAVLFPLLELLVEFVVLEADTLDAEEDSLAVKDVAELLVLCADTVAMSIAPPSSTANRIKQRTASFESVSTASDATVPSWQAEDEELFEAEQLDIESIPLHSFGQEASIGLPGTGVRLHRSWHGFPKDIGKAIHFFGALFSILLFVALLPWLAGQSSNPNTSEVVMANSTRVLQTSILSASTIPPSAA